MKTLTADMASDARITEAPRHQSATGYGPKIPTRYMLRIANRWHRVYVAQYSNSGSPYVVFQGADHYLSNSTQFVLETLAEGGTFQSAIDTLLAPVGVNPLPAP